MTIKRRIPRQALTREQVAKMSDDDLSARLSPAEIKAAVALTKATFPTAAPKKRDDESTGEYRRRVRTSKTVDEAEFARSLRQVAELQLYNSAAQKRQRALDLLGAAVTPESVAKREAVEAERAQRDKERDRLSDFSAVPYPPGVAGPSVEWEGGKEGKGKK